MSIPLKATKWKETSEIDVELRMHGNFHGLVHAFWAWDIGIIMDN